MSPGDRDNDDDARTRGSVGPDDSTFGALLREAAHVSDGAPVDPGARLDAGALLAGRFEVARKLGAGGMGTVYEVRDRAHGAAMALKILHSRRADWLRRIRHEFTALQDIAHPNLVNLGELLEDGGRWFFSMELVDGVDFMTWVRPGGAVCEARLRDALAQLAGGLAALHAAGKVHRDVKPSNVMVTGDGRVVLVDFGLTSQADRGESPVVGGTPAYMAPEQAAGDEVGPAADWYAVGVMLYEALAGALPHSGGRIEILDARMRGEPPAPLPAGAPSDLAALCRELLAADPEARPDAAAVAARLGAGAVTTAPVDAPFIGRAVELAALRRVADGAGARVVWIAGESGVGKSALLARWGEELTAGGFTVLAGRCYERVSLPYKAADAIAAELSARLLELADDEVRALLPAGAEHLVTLLPILGEVPVLAARAAEAAVSDPLEQQRRAFDAFRALLGELAALGPLALLLDDAQWADRDGLELLLHAVSGDGGPSILLALAARGPAPERVRDALGALTEVALEPLSPDDAATLARTLAGDAAAGAIVREAGGHPLFIAELARHGGAGQRLDDALAARYRALPAPQREVASLVALAGAPLPQETIRHAAGLPAAGFSSAVAGLRAAQLVRTHGPAGTDGIEPYHDRVREAVAAALADAHARHGQLADSIEATELAERDPEQMLYHLDAAGRQSDAAAWAERAAARAERALAFERAAALYERAIELGDRGDDTTLLERLGDARASAGRGGPAAEAYLDAAVRVNGSAQFDLRRKAAEQLLRAGHTDRGLEIVDDVLAEVGLPRSRESRGAVVSLLWQRARVRLGGLRPRRRQEPLGELEQQRLAACWSAVVGLSMASPLRSVEYQARHLRLALAAGDERRIALGLVLEGIGAAAGGPPAKRAARLLDEAARWAERVGDPHTAAYVELGRGTAAFLCGEWPRAHTHADRAETIFRGDCIGAAWEIGTAQRVSLTCLWHMGRIAELRRRVREAVADAERRGDRYTLAQMRTVLEPNILLMEDRPDEAKRVLATAGADLTRRRVQLQHWQHMQATALVHLYCGEGKAAADHIDACWRGIKKAFLLRVQAVRVFSYFVRATANLGAQVDGAGDRRARVRADRRRLIREHADLSGAHLFAGQLALLDGETAIATEQFRAAADQFRAGSMGLLAAVASWRAGDRAAAEATLRAEGIVRPDRVVAMLAPVGSEPTFAT